MTGLIREKGLQIGYRIGVLAASFALERDRLAQEGITWFFGQHVQ